MKFKSKKVEDFEEIKLGSVEIHGQVVNSTLRHDEEGDSATIDRQKLKSLDNFQIRMTHHVLPCTELQKYNVELFARYRANIVHGNSYFTDSNGLNLVKRSYGVSE